MDARASGAGRAPPGPAPGRAGAGARRPSVLGSSSTRTVLSDSVVREVEAPRASSSGAARKRSGAKVEGGGLPTDGRPAPGHRHHARRNLEPALLQGREEVGALQRHRRESAGNLSMKRTRIEGRWSLAVATTKEETRPVRSTIAFGFTLMLALALAACSSGGASPTPSASTAPPATGAAVTIVDFAFQPAALTVKAGDTA